MLATRGTIGIGRCTRMACQTVCSAHFIAHVFLSVTLVHISRGHERETENVPIIRTDRDLYNALATANITHAVLAKDIVLTNEVFPGGAAALLVNSDLYISGINSDDGQMPILDYNYMQGRIRILPGYQLVFDNILSKNLRRGPGMSADWYLRSPGAALVGNNTIIWQSVCALINITQLQSLQRPSQRPGVQRVKHLRQPLCLRDLCWPEYVIFEDVAAASVPPSSEFTDGGGYDLVRINVTRVCDQYISEACIQLKGEETCVFEALEQRQHSGRQGQSTTTTVLASVLATASVAAAAMLLALYRRRRQSRQHQHKELPGGPEGTPDADVAAPGSAPWLDEPGRHDKLEQRRSMGSVCGDSAGWPSSPSRAAASPRSQQLALPGPSSGKHMQVPRSALQLAVDQVVAAQPPGSAPASCFLRGRRNGQALRVEDLPAIHLGALLGTGCFGRVYKATLDGSTVAVKVLEYDLRAAARVQNELDCCNALRHRNVTSTELLLCFGSAAAAAAAEGAVCIQIPGEQQAGSEGAADQQASAPAGCAHGSSACGAGAQRGAGPGPCLVTWIVMGYCDRGTLWRLIEEWEAQPLAGKLPVLLAVLLDVARGMAYVHSCGVCHGDLKAANVLLASDASAPHGMVAKVADFGLSRALAMGASHLSTRSYGTVTHMAPELLASGHLRPASDVYSFGILMYEVLSGQRYFEGLMHGEIIHKVIIERARPQMPAGVPPALHQLAADCWAQQAEARPTCQQVLQRLEAAAAAAEARDRRLGEIIDF